MPFSFITQPVQNSRQTYMGIKCLDCVFISYSLDDIERRHCPHCKKSHRTEKPQPLNSPFHAPSLPGRIAKRAQTPSRRGKIAILGNGLQGSSLCPSGCENLLLWHQREYDLWHGLPNLLWHGLPTVTSPRPKVSRTYYRPNGRPSRRVR